MAERAERKGARRHVCKSWGGPRVAGTGRWGENWGRKEAVVWEGGRETLSFMPL